MLLTPARPSPDAGETTFAGALDILGRRLAPRSDAPVAVAFSGGGDSLALLLTARSWARSTGRRILALTVDHGLQPQSAVWTRSAAATAGRLGVDFQALAWTGDKPATGLPAAARRARHALLADAARDAGARVILFGHTLDDELEARLMRGEGSTLGVLSEWAPSPVWPEGHGLFLLRPLLGVRRAALRAWLAEAGHGWIDDPANDDLKWSRARARREVEASALHDAGAFAGEAPDKDLQILARQATAGDFGVIRLPRDALQTVRLETVQRFVAMACVCAGGGEGRPRGARAMRLAARLADGETFTAALAGARIEADKDDVRILRDAGEAARGGLAPMPLTPGRAAVWDGRFEMGADEAGLTVVALKGRMGRLSPPARGGLKAAPAAARPALPAVAAPGHGESLICPILEQDGKVRARCLVGERLAAACGTIAKEIHANLRRQWRSDAEGPILGRQVQ